MGGRGGQSILTRSRQNPPTAIPRNYQQLTQSQAKPMFDAIEASYSDDINLTLAIQQYIRQDQQANGFTMSQNMNHKLENGQPLNANEQYVANRLMTGMHDIGQDVVLTRAAHADFLQALGVSNYQNMSDAQLNAAVQGAEYTERKFVSAAVDPSKNPFLGNGPAAGGREVVIKIKAGSDTKCVLGNRQQSEVILGQGVKFRALSCHFDGTTAHPRSGGTLPRVVVEVEVVKQ